MSKHNKKPKYPTYQWRFIRIFYAYIRGVYPLRVECGPVFQRGESNTKCKMRAHRMMHALKGITPGEHPLFEHLREAILIRHHLTRFCEAKQQEAYERRMQQ